ncbi:MAG: HAMP domain-containing protein [Proteobacteria bacterium]|nr:HAMP domain-containing protein [Pseudomonadota bacterium]
MSFRHRLALFLIVTLVAVQTLTAVSAYIYLRQNLIETGKRELATAMNVFTQQLNFLSERAGDGVRVLSLDYALRAAIAQHDHGTELSAMRNHGRRIGARRMMLIDLQGSTVADTAAPNLAAAAFPFGALLQSAAMRDTGTALASLDGKIYWIVIVPVRAPVPIAFIAAFIPVDTALLERMRTISIKQRSVVLGTWVKGEWRVVAESATPYRVDLQTFAGAGQKLQTEVSAHDGSEYLTAASRLATTPGSAPVVAVLGYSLDDILAPYRSVVWPMASIFMLALLAAMGGAMFIVRKTAKPIETLAAAAQRIAAGDYTPPQRLAQRDELGNLGDTLIAMTEAIAERQARLTRAVEATEIAREEAVRANNAKSQFLANMSHELRTPLNAIVGFAQMLEQEVLGPLGVARYRDYASDIHESGRHLLGQVERMLDLAESEAGKLVLMHEHASPGVLLLEGSVLLRSFAQKSGVVLCVPQEIAEWPQIECDPARLRLAFVNIIHNAIKFTPVGGLVTVTGRAAPGQLFVRVEDTGVGIEPELLGLVTRPFQRLRSALDGQHQGAGLGLPFAKVVIERHGGSVVLESNVGVGTAVSIILPLETGAVNRAA